MTSPARGLRFPAALQIFPGLRDYIHVRPRRLAAIPIANTHNLRHQDVPACLRHVYHDLGVLVFAGLSNKQIRGVGDAIQVLVSSGGIGTLLTAVDWKAKAKRRRVPPPDKEDYYSSVDWAHSGVLKPKALFNIADTHLPEEITSLILLRIPSADPSTLQLRERGMLVKGNPMPKGVLHSTVDGPKILPLDCFTSVRVDPKFSNIYGEVILFSGGGKGQFAGSIRVDYTLLRSDDEKQQMKTMWIPQDEDDVSWEDEEKSPLSGNTSKMLTAQVFRPLWQLEREVYGDKADRLVNYDAFKTGLKGWSPSKPGKRTRDDNSRSNTTW